MTGGVWYTTLRKKKKKNFLIYREIGIGMGSGEKSYMRKCTNIFTIYEEVVGHK
jgi:hypothetical protein